MAQSNRIHRQPFSTVASSRAIQAAVTEPVPARDEVLVLVPRLPGFALSLGEQHGLHRLDVRVDHLGEDLDDGGVRQRLAYHVRDLVGGVDGRVPADRHVVGLAWRSRRHPADVAAFATADLQRLGAQQLDLVRGQRVGNYGVAVALVALEPGAGGIVGSVL
jgi:hypothetical protein